MRARTIIAALTFLLSTCSRGQEVAGAAANSAAIHDLIGQYAKAVDTVDLKLVAQIWSHSPDVAFIYPLGEEHGFDYRTQCL